MNKRDEMVIKRWKEIRAMHASWEMANLYIRSLKDWLFAIGFDE